MSQPHDPKEYVQRALNAAEIADSCLEPKIRAQFFSLSQMWLESAEEAAARQAAEGQSPDA